jgi:hypothetical protein
MKMEEVVKYEIFVDLDGTLVDFGKKAQEITGMNKPVDTLTPKEKRHFWGAVVRHEKGGGEFWGEMEFMPDGLDLWGYIKKYDPTVLTASGDTGDAPREKREWTAKHLGPNVKIIVVRASKDKAHHAKPNHILIDDAKRAIDPWVAAGGIGIKFENAFQVIRELQKLGL